MKGQSAEPVAIAATGSVTAAATCPAIMYRVIAMTASPTTRTATK